MGQLPQQAKRRLRAYAERCGKIAGSDNRCAQDRIGRIRQTGARCAAERTAYFLGPTQPFQLIETGICSRGDAIEEFRQPAYTNLQLAPVMTGFRCRPEGQGNGPPRFPTAQDACGDKYPAQIAVRHAGPVHPIARRTPGTDKHWALLGIGKGHPLLDFSVGKHATA